VTVGGGDIIDRLQSRCIGATGSAITVGFWARNARAINADEIWCPRHRHSNDATGSGNGGSVVFWSNLATDFMGTIGQGGSQRRRFLEYRRRARSGLGRAMRRRRTARRV
jgi:hypothetical protein